MNSIVSEDEIRLLGCWVHLYLYHFNRPDFLKSAVSGVAEDELPNRIIDTYSAIPLVQIARQAEWVESAIAWTVSNSNTLIPLYSPQYPQLLAQTSDPPALLFVCGDPAVLHLPQLAIVGSRQPSPDGRMLATEFAGRLCTAGFVVTSGLASGIDAHSHQGALDKKGRTIAVLGSGIDSIYPRRHKMLARAVTESGALVSEYLPGAQARDWHFPRRNRIISGLCHGVLVVEAAQRSGSLITARLAADQGREVFAIPGSIRNPKTRGCHWLIKKGAKLTENLDDILEELPGLLQWSLQISGASIKESAGLSSPQCEVEIDEKDRALLVEIGFDPVPLEQLVNPLKTSITELMARLAILEMNGLVVCESGAYRRLGAS